jgi:hypothetical protein
MTSAVSTHHPKVPHIGAVRLTVDPTLQAFIRWSACMAICSSTLSSETVRRPVLLAQDLVGSGRHVGRFELLRNPLEVVDHGLDLLVVTIEEVRQRHADLLFEIRRHRVIGAVSPVRFVAHRITVQGRLEIHPI